MSELKVFELKVGKNLETDSPLVVGVDDKWNSRVMSGEKVYLKYEADEVIKELKHSLDLATDECCSISERAVKQLRHQKYRRCLAMADYAIYHHFRMLEIHGHSLDNNRAVFKLNYGLRWRCRWLELAEKFKPNREQ